MGKHADLRPRHIRQREEEWQMQPALVKRKGIKAFEYMPEGHGLKPGDPWRPVLGDVVNANVWKRKSFCNFVGMGVGMDFAIPEMKMSALVRARQMIADAHIERLDKGMMWVNSDNEFVKFHDSSYKRPSPFQRCDFFNKFCDDVRKIEYKAEGAWENFDYEIMEEFNLRRLGRGNFSTVVECPWDTTKAIKLGFGSGHHGNPLDDGWLTYAQFCIQYKDDSNPLLMKVHQLRLFRRYYIAIIDRYHTEVGNVYNMPEVSHKVNSVRKVLGGRMYCGSEHHKTCDTYELHAYRLKEKMDKHKLRVTDLHSGNAMYDNGKVVITDPFDFSRPSIKDELISLGVEAA